MRKSDTIGTVCYRSTFKDLLRTILNSALLLKKMYSEKPYYSKLWTMLNIWCAPLSWWRWVPDLLPSHSGHQDDAETKNISFLVETLYGITDSTQRLDPFHLDNVGLYKATTEYLQKLKRPVASLLKVTTKPCSFQSLFYTIAKTVLWWWTLYWQSARKSLAENFPMFWTVEIS